MFLTRVVKQNFDVTSNGGTKMWVIPHPDGHPEASHPVGHVRVFLLQIIREIGFQVFFLQIPKCSRPVFSAKLIFDIFKFAAYRLRLALPREGVQLVMKRTNIFFSANVQLLVWFQIFLPVCGRGLVDRRCLVLIVNFGVQRLLKSAEIFVPLCFFVYVLFQLNCCDFSSSSNCKQGCAKFVWSEDLDGVSPN